MILKAEKTSERDFYKALEIIRNRMGQTHAIQTTPKGGVPAPSEETTNHRPFDE